MTDAERDEARRSALAAAQTLEKRGLVDAAVTAYRSAGAPEEAARLLAGQRRFLEAGELLFASLEVPVAKVVSLDPARKRLALNAAVCFARHGDVSRAVELFVALGERGRAAELLRRAGNHVEAARIAEGQPVLNPAAAPAGAQRVTLAGAQRLETEGRFESALEAFIALRRSADAARMAQRLGRHAQAAELYIEGGLAFQAAGAYQDAHDPAKALEALRRTPRDGPEYRTAAQLAIRVASELNALDFQLEHFLTKFLSEAPQSERDVEALYLVARLYERNDFLENAKDAYRKVLAAKPSYRDASHRLDGLERETHGSAMIYEQILKEDASFHGRRVPGAELPSLPSLPGLASLPGLPGLPPEAAATMAHRRPVTPMPTTLSDADAWARDADATWAPGTTPAPFGATPPPRVPSAPTRATPLPPLPAPPAPTEAFPVAHPASPSAPRPPAPPPPLALVPGAVIAGRYRLDKKIGQGGMASVFRAHDLELGEDVAMKIFTKLVEDEQMIARFKQELLLSRQLNHPNIIRLYDIGTVQGFKYITMELLTGTDLKDRLGKPLDLKSGVGLMLQACAALQHAHDKGVVHRDIKPANIFVTDDGTVKVMDFGIAKRTATPGLTVAGMIAGTPEYMSPEQINGFDKVTGSTDLYALGITLYEMFTGQVPFRHPELMPVLVMQMTDVPPAPRTRNPAIPAALEAVILRLLEKEPAKRFGSCAELGRALQTLVA